MPTRTLSVCWRTFASAAWTANHGTVGGIRSIVICIIKSIISMRFSIIVAADNLWTQAADFDCPILKRPEPLRCAGLPTGRVGQRKSAA